MITRQSIVDAARAYLGVRFHHQGRNRAGIDCAGLIVCVAHDVGIAAQDLHGYGRTPDPIALRHALDAQAVPTPERKPGDILLLRFGGEPRHLGIMTDYGIIHAYAPVRRVVEHRLDTDWAAAIVATYAFPGVAP